MKKAVIIGVITLIAAGGAHGFTTYSQVHAAAVTTRAALSPEECRQQAKLHYVREIKAQGTPMVIDGKEGSGLSNDQWQAINNKLQARLLTCGR